MILKIKNFSDKNIPLYPPLGFEPRSFDNPSIETATSG